MSEHENETMEELHQQDLPVVAVPVEVRGPVQAQQLPTRVGTMRSWVLTTTGEQILGRDPRRRRAVIIADTEPIYLGDSENVAGGYGFLLQETLPLELTHSEEVWARCATASATTTISVLVEQWAE